MSVFDLTENEIQSNILNYLKKQKSEGGKYSLAELRRELKRRNGKGFSGRDVVSHILSLCKKSEDRLATYKELHSALYPGREWKGHGSLKPITQALDAAICYCYENSLPVVTVLITSSANRKLTEQAKQSIFEVCRDLGFETGTNVDKFVQDELVRSRHIVQVGLLESAEAPNDP